MKVQGCLATYCMSDHWSLRLADKYIAKQRRSKVGNRDRDYWYGTATGEAYP